MEGSAGEAYQAQVRTPHTGEEDGVLDMSSRLAEVRDAVMDAVDPNYVRVLRFLDFCMKKALTCDLSFSCDL
jgi:hypothetical protein